MNTLPKNWYTALYTNPNPKPHLSKDVKLIFQKQIAYVMNSLLAPKIGTLLYTLILTLNPISQKKFNYYSINRLSMLWIACLQMLHCFFTLTLTHKFMHSLLDPEISKLFYTLTLTLNPISEKMLK